ncbi:MAG TPA: ABC transporter permease [Terriglobales bacterium]|nr:ABC transporter permease [Terriglobales bacterium]
MNGWFQDLRYAVRLLRKAPGFALTAILTLALGTCSSLAIFGFVDAALIQPLPYPSPDRLVVATESVALLPRANLSYYDYLDWKRLNQVFSSIDVYNQTGFLLRTASKSEPVHGARVSDGFFRTLGVAPILGRDFYTGEDVPQGPQTALLTYGAWQQRFGGRKDISGQTVTLSGTPFTIIGVLPQGFQFAPAGNAEFWTTLHASDQCGRRRSCHNLTGIARLKDGLTLEAARSNIETIAKQLELQYPVDNRGQGVFVDKLSSVVFADLRPMLLALQFGAALLLLISFVNVSSLLLVRSEGRKREIAVRGALGASRIRVIRQFALEGLCLTVASCALGILGAGASMQILKQMISSDLLDYMPYLSGLGITPHVLELAGALCVGAMALFAAAPIARFPFRRLRDGLSEGGRGNAGTLWRRFGSNLVVVELSLAVVLLVSAGLLGKSLYRLLRVEVGFQPDHLATVDVALSETDYAKEEQQARAEQEITSRVARVPGVESVGVTSVLPVSYNGNTIWIRVVGHPYNGEHNEVNERDVSPGFFTTIRAKRLRGRDLTEFDDASKPRVAIINRAFEQKYFPGEDPIGKKIGDNQLSPKSIAEIVGVVEDVRDGSLEAEIWPAVYYPFAQSSDTYFSLVARTSQNEGSTLQALVNTIHEVDSGIGTLRESSMAERINNSPSAYMHRSSAWLVGGFASLALLLAVVGLYGVIAYSVSCRTREIGVRMALGAQRRSVYRLIMKEAVWLTAIGVAAGLAGSLAIANLIRGLLFGVRSWDAATLVATAAALAIASLAASYFPARRAAKVDPMVALRYE